MPFHPDLYQATTDLIHRIRKVAEELRRTAVASREVLNASSEALRTKAVPEKFSDPRDRPDHASTS